MIPRHQTILFFTLLAASLIMGGVLWHLRERAHQRLLEGEDSAPTQAPQVTPAEQATLMAASDTDNSVQPRILTLPLPQNPEARARVVLGKLLDLYAAPGAAHPVPGGSGSVAQVFLLPVTGADGKPVSSGAQMAVVNLTGAFANSHPSGLQTETLTVLSICATLNANLQKVAQVRFLVDGEPRATLAGHADLSRTYLTAGSAADAGGTHP